jgi:hypothetical protein
VFHNPPLKGKIMNTATTKATAITALTVALLAVTNVSSAFAFPDPGEPCSPSVTHRINAPDCVDNSGVRLLERIGTQFVRGDDLTGAGSPAPSWIPEVQ